DLVNQILADLHAPALTQPPEVENALGHAVTGLLGVVAATHTAVESLEKELGRVFDEHPMAPILTSVPGLG
ncbi:IS110 family transposase, partial [Rhodococcus cerastii]|nr:IS110 family transposase [Rhodococcus cerastii]